MDCVQDTWSKPVPDN
jgi:hypothetical protein